MKTVAEHLGSVILAIAALAMLVGLTLGFKEPVGTFMENIIDQLEAKVDDAFGFGNGSGDEGDAGGEQGPTISTLEGDGQTFDAGVPAPLTFRSPAPLSEFQELTLNGETVDPSNYSKEEGSTIVTLAAAYLETLDTGSYEIAIVSDSMIGEGTFDVSVASGAYDAEGNLVATWTELANTYGMDVSKDYTASTYKTDTASPYYVLTNTAELSEAKNLIIPASVTTIGKYSFANCTSLKTVTFGSGSQLTTIGEYAFCSCTNLASIEIPASVTAIGYSAFKSCTSLTSVTFAEGSQLTTIGGDTFYNCTNLERIEIPAMVTNIQNGVFENCTGLKTVTFAEGSQLTTIGNVTAMTGHGPFKGCTSLTSIEIPAGVTTIGYYAFYNCDSLTSVTFAEGSRLTTIGDHAFRSCSQLTSIDLPAGVTSIGKQGFDQCTNLTSITFAGPVAHWSAITKGTSWNGSSTYGYIPATVVQCSDGSVSLR